MPNAVGLQTDRPTDIQTPTTIHTESFYTHTYTLELTHTSILVQQPNKQTNDRSPPSGVRTAR